MNKEYLYVLPSCAIVIADLVYCICYCIKGDDLGTTSEVIFLSFVLAVFIILTIALIVEAVKNKKSNNIDKLHLENLQLKNECDYLKSKVTDLETKNANLNEQLNKYKGII